MEDLTDREFGNLKAKRYIGKGTWECECSCGKITKVKTYNLVNKRISSCGHTKNETKEDLTGRQIYEWDVITYLGNGKYTCECSCGKRSEVDSYSLKSGHSKSCGHTSGKLKDMTNTYMWDLHIIDYYGGGKWNCECSCGTKFVASGRDIRYGNTKSCGHNKSGKLINLTGKKFGEWTITEYAGNSLWKCECSCGETRNVHSSSLRNELSTNCGSSIHRLKDITNKTFGELTAEEYIGNGFWRCICSCGNYKDILGINLRNESTRSCGCMTDELLKNTLLSKYGEVCPIKVNNPRSLEQIKTLSEKDILESFIINYTCKYNKKPCAYDIAKLIGVTTSTVMRYVKLYNLQNEIEINEWANKSKYEQELSELFPGAIKSDKSVLNGLELDLLFKERSIAIEFNGDYWHSDIYKDKFYHQNKTMECLKQGIQLIHIFEYEWRDTNTKHKIINLIKNRLDTPLESIYARKTVIKEIGNDEAILFANLYHLQNGINSSINIGMYYNEELIGLMTFGKPRFNSEYQYELLRLVWKSEVKVVGGSEKLFSYFIKTYNPHSIISYCNIAKFSGNIYTKLGFKTDSAGLTEPNYVWVNCKTNDILSRYKTQKKHLLELGLGTEGMTEDEIMKSLGYLKIYNSGNLKFIWNKV